MSEKIPDLAHEAANRLNGVSTVAGCLLIKLKNTTNLTPELLGEIIKSLGQIEEKAREAYAEIDKIKNELRSRNQYF